MDQEQIPSDPEGGASGETSAAADSSGSKVRVVAFIATLIALLAISIPFVLRHEDAPEGTPSPVASHDAVPASGGKAGDGGACMADAKPARMDFTLPDLDNKQVTLESFKGKVVLLNFWATWCGPCKAEIPGFVELQSKYPDDLVVVGFSVDDPADKARAFAEEYKINYPILLGLGRDEVQDAYGPIWGIPTSFLIGRDGRVCKKHMGIAPKAVFEREIQALL
jgi:cytochrome c biogenesis protein CcmG/thiol:disulfide interchange protein DsbE